MKHRCAVTVVVLSLMVAGLAQARPESVRLSWTRPDTSTSMTVSWTTDSPANPTIGQFGVASVDENTVHGTTLPAAGELGVTHTVEFTNLAVGTLYRYRVGGEGGWSDEGTFRTSAPDGCTPFRFVALGDNRPDADWLPQLKWNPILEEAVNAGPSFILHTGDIVKEGKTRKQWADFLQNSTPYMARVPLMAAIGNHDDGPVDGDGSNYAHVFAYPRNDVTGTEDYYYFTYGDAIFVSLSTQTFRGGTIPFQEQADWLDRVLTANPRKWKFVFLHHPPYTSHARYDLLFTEFEFNHPPNENNQNPALVPVFDKHHVDMVFAGHNHYYERFRPLRQGPTHTDGTPVSTYDEGTVYVITGGAGAMVYDDFNIPFVDFQIDLVQWVCGKAKGSEVCKGDHHYVLIEIDDGHLRYEAWATSQQTVTNHPDNTRLIDAFDIYKAPTQACDEVPLVDIVEEVRDEDVVTQPEVGEVVEIVSQPDLTDHDRQTPADKEGQVPAELIREASVSLDSTVDSPGQQGSIPPKSGGCSFQNTSGAPTGLLLSVVMIALWVAGATRARRSSSYPSHRQRTR